MPRAPAFATAWRSQMACDDPPARTRRPPGCVAPVVGGRPTVLAAARHPRMRLGEAQHWNKTGSCHRLGVMKSNAEPYNIRRGRRGAGQGKSQTEPSAKRATKQNTRAALSTVRAWTEIGLGDRNELREVVQGSQHDANEGRARVEHTEGHQQREHCNWASHTQALAGVLPLARGRGQRRWKSAPMA